MIRCVLCDKTFKTDRGLAVHLARTHDVQGVHGRISLKAITEFFPLLEKKRWTKAEKILKKVTKTTDVDEWIKGYLHALNGMIIALKSSHSTPRPYIVDLDELNTEKLQEVKDGFSQLSDDLRNKKEFDAAYFQAWENFTHYLLQTQS